MTSALIVEPGTVAVVTLNRPERRNSLTVAATQELAAALKDLSAVSRALVITGAGSAFCSGGDFDELVSFSAASPEESAAGLYAGFQNMIRTVRELDVPVIAAVNGPAMGAGLDLALACDLRIASENARLGQVWARLGLVPGTGGAFWTTLLAGPARASEMLLTAEPVDAETALAWGLINYVVSPAELIGKSVEIGDRIAKLPRQAVAENKRLLNATTQPAYELALDKAREIQTQRFASQEFADALQAARRA